MTVDFGLARAIDAQSFGEPGQRTFRLRLVGAGGQTASLWLEKEHLGALGLAFRQVLSQVGREVKPQGTDVGAFPDAPDRDFRVGGIGVGFDESAGAVVLQVGEAGADEAAAVLFRLSLGQCAALIRQLDEIVAAGRPVCPLCGLAIDPSGHVCIRSNGDSDQPIPDADISDD